MSRAVLATGMKGHFLIVLVMYNISNTHTSVVKFPGPKYLELGRDRFYLNPYRLNVFGWV